MSVARAVVDANQILNEGSAAPMGITEFRATLKVHASVNVKPVAITGKTRFSAKEVYARTMPLHLRDLAHMSVRERILTNYTQTADLEITSVIQPLPVVVQS